MKALGIDVGTTSIKTAILDSESGIIDSSSIDISDLIHRPQPNFSERDVQEVWKKVVRAIRALKHIRSVEAVSVDATSGTIIALDSEGKPLFPSILYADKRSQKEAGELLEKSESARRYQPLLPVDASLVLPKILWIRRNFDFEKVSRILHESDYIVKKLCGATITSPNVAGKSHIDIMSGNYLKGVYEELDIPLEIMPPVAEVGEIVGFITQDASTETGLPFGIPVVNGVTDATAGDIATGTLKKGQLNATIGATLVVHAVVDRPVPDIKKRIYYKTFLESTYIAGGATDAGTIPLEAISNLLSLDLHDLDLAASKVPAGCDGLLAQPQWTGTRVPDFNPNVRGFFVGMSVRNCTPGHIFRSLLEGNASILHEVVKIVEEVTGVSIAEIRACGGGSKSDIQNQIVADMTGLEVLALENIEPAVGSAILAAWGSDRKQDIYQLAAKVVKLRRRYVPQKSLTETYQKQSILLRSLTAKIYG
ncbi:MAG: xylulokinase [Thermoproteota archaeon]